MASRRHIGRSFLNRNTGRIPAVTLVMRVDPRSALPAVTRPVHRGASIETTKMLPVRPVLLSGGPSLHQDGILLCMASILHHAHLWSRNPMTVGSSVDSHYLAILPVWEISVSGPLLPHLHHDTFQRMATPSTTTMRGRQAQGCL